MGKMLKVPEDHTEPVAFSVNRSATADLNDNSVWQKTVDSSGYHKYTGWLLSPHEEHYLMFVPITAGLPDSPDILPLPQSASVDFTSSTLGSEWCNCFFL